MTTSATGRRPGPAPQGLDPGEAQRLADLRASANAARAKLDNDRPRDPLGRLAWLAGLYESPADPAPIRQAIEAARAAGLPWRQIAGALGEGDTRADGRRVMDRYRAWGGQH